MSIGIPINNSFDDLKLMNNQITDKKIKSAQPIQNSRLIFVIYCIGILVIIGIAIVGATTNMSVYELVNDPSLPHSGVLTKLGILLWCSTAAICFFSASVLRRYKGRMDVYRFTLFSGILTSILMLDDLFLLHEYDGLLVNYLGLGRLGLSEKVIFLSYALLVLYGIIKFRGLLKKESLLLYVALLFFGLSIAVDTVFSTAIKSWIGFGAYSWVEESCKWIGILSWFAYYSKTCFNYVTDCYQRQFSTYNSAQIMNR